MNEIFLSPFFLFFFWGFCGGFFGLKFF
jgi:hypothetical protein